MDDQNETNPKITQVADPRFKRLNDAFAKYLLAKEDHIGFLEDFVKAVVEHTPAEVRFHEIKSLTNRNAELYREHAKEKAGYPIYLRCRIPESCLIWKCKPTEITICSLGSFSIFPSSMARNRTKEKSTASLKL